MTRWLPAALLALAAVAPLGCAGETEEREPEPKPDPWARAAAWLASRQDDDGALRSRHYGYLSSGYSLTATNAYALALAPAEVRARQAAFFRRALAFLDAGTDETGAIGLDVSPVGYPAYTTTFTLLALEVVRPAGWERRAARQRERLLAIQHDEDLGWSKDDSLHGSFSFGGRTERKPAGDGSANVSVTAFAVEALRAAGVDPSGAELGAARRYLLRCRSRAEEDGTRGFHFATSPLEYRSKATPISEVEREDARFAAYGSTTADAVRGLLAAGASADDAAVRSALDWLRARFGDGSVNPGFPDDRRSVAEGIHLYWLMAAARALAAAGENRWDWRGPIRARVLECQRDDGAFVGPSSLMKEDDPLVGTPLALMALAACDAPR